MNRPAARSQDARAYLGARLREARLRQDIGVRELARRVGVSPAHISQIEKGKADEDKLLAAALDAGADDMSDDDEGWEIVCAPERFEAVKDAVKALGVEPTSAAIAMIPQNFIKLVGKEAQQMLRLMEAIEDHDDVQHVWANFDVEEKEIEASLA
jgi:transcriptional/translational regulatory protein YebC/TACO1